MKMLALMKMPMMKILFTLLIIGSLPALSAAQATKSASAKPASTKPVSLQGTKTPFLEEFSKADTVASRWEEVTNGGSLIVSDHRLALTGNGGKGFPVLTTRTSPFPSLGDWTVSFSYRYTSIGHYGTDLFCSRTSGPELVAVHQDVNNQVIAINGKPISSTPSNTEWHVVSVVKSGLRVTAFLDGKEVGGDAMGVPPASVRLGGCLVDNPWDWNDLEVQFVRVDVGQHPLGLNALLDLDALHLAKAAAPATLTVPGKSNSVSDKASASNQASASDKVTTTVILEDTNLEDAKPEDVKYKIVNLGGFPAALHTNWFLELEVTNNSGATVSATGMQVEILFGDASKLPLTLYDPEKSSQAGLFLNVISPAIESYTIKAHTKKVFHAYFFDSDLISTNYRGQAHRPDGLIVTAGSKRVAILPVLGF